jgi:hypothetical protein
MRRRSRCFESGWSRNRRADEFCFEACLEPFPFRWNRNGAPGFCFDAFSSREPVSTSLENALSQRDHASRQKPRGVNRGVFPFTANKEINRCRSHPHETMRSALPSRRTRRRLSNCSPRRACACFQRPSGSRAGAFSSEVGTGSREENALFDRANAVELASASAE